MSEMRVKKMKMEEEEIKHEKRMFVVFSEVGLGKERRTTEVVC